MIAGMKNAKAIGMDWIEARKTRAITNASIRITRSITGKAIAFTRKASVAVMRRAIARTLAVGGNL
jgi:hypothetical protein